MNLLQVIFFGQVVYCLRYSENSDTVYIRPPNERGPKAWQSGLKCLQTVGSLFLYKKAKDTQLNMVITISNNMSTPAAQIQEQYLILKNEAVTDTKKDEYLSLYLTSIISDVHPPLRTNFSSKLIASTDTYVIVVDNVDLLCKFFDEYISRMQSWNPGARFIILFNNVEDRNTSLAVASEIFELVLYQYYVNTVTLLYAVNNTAYDFYILDNFNPESCREVRAKKISTCEMGEMPDKNYVKRFVKKIIRKASLQNCTFKMCAEVSPPYIEDECSEGLELHLINVIKKQMGFKVDSSCGSYGRGIRENLTWTGILGRLNDGECDFVIGGFFSDNEVREDFWSTESYLSDTYTWYIALASPRPPWKALFIIFYANIWYCIGITLLITWIFWLTFGCILPEKKGHKSVVLTAINSLGATLGYAVNERPECQTSRIFFIGLCLYCLNVTSLYTSKLIAVFANPGHEHQISTIKEVIHQGIPFGGPAENRDWFDNPYDGAIFKRYNISDYFVAKSSNFSATWMGERVILANRMFMLRNQNINKIFMFPDSVFTSSVEIIAKRGFPFLDRFNVLIGQMKDGGLFSKINRDFLYNYTIIIKIRKLRDDLKEDVIVLTIHHLEGAFAVLGFGILLGIMAFFGEQINFRYFYPWLCKKFNWKNEMKKQKLKIKKRKKKKRKSQVRDEMKTIINVRMEQIRFTPLKRRKIRLS